MSAWPLLDLLLLVVIPLCVWVCVTAYLVVADAERGPRDEPPFRDDEAPPVLVGAGVALTYPIVAAALIVAGLCWLLHRVATLLVRRRLERASRRRLIADLERELL